MVSGVGRSALLLVSSIRRKLLTLLLVAQLGTVLALALTAGRISESAESEHTARVLSANAAESANAVQAHLEPAEAIVDLTSSLLVDGDIDNAALEDSFQEALTRTPQMSGVFLASPDGDFLFVSREAEGFRHKITEVDGISRTTMLDFYAEDGDLIDSMEDPTDTYDPTVRPWYEGAVANTDQAVWTEPYVFFTSQQLGITAARSIVRNGEVVGVVGADIELGELSTFLAELDVEESGGTILVDRSGTVVAHPDTDLLQVPDGEGFRTVSILELGDPYAQSATAVLLNDTDNASTGVQDFTDEAAGPSRVAFESVNFGNVDWTLGVYAPADAIVADLTNARAQERVLTITIGVLTVLLFGLFVFPATRRIDDLAEFAATDALTGLPNRRTIMADAERLAGNTGDRSVAMLDVDYFKQVNDKYGHQTGDVVLKSVAHRLIAALPEGADIGRIGGEEFLILLPDHGASSAERTAERLRQTVRNVAIETDAGDVNVSVSIGVASATKTATRDTLMSIADTALREAKRTGRDAVVVQQLSGVETVT